MSDQSDTDEDVETTAVTEEDEEEEETTDQDVVVDLESAEDTDERIDRLESKIDEQREEIEELEDLLLDLSTRVADGKGMGVCPECHGPVQKVSRWFGATTIECRQCGEVFHEY